MQKEKRSIFLFDCLRCTLFAGWSVGVITLHRGQYATYMTSIYSMADRGMALWIQECVDSRAMLYTAALSV